MSKQIANIDNLSVKGLLNLKSVRDRFEDMLGEKAAGFISSIINTANSNKTLAKCDPKSIVGAAAVAASLDLPIDQNLGFAAIVPYGNKAQFQMMYRGYIQLAIRTGQYQKMNVTEVYEDELEFYNPLTGEISFKPIETWKFRYEGNEEKIVGYYAYFKLINGFEQSVYWTKKQVEAHARKYSKSFNNKNGMWQKDFDSMAKKTVLKLLLSKWGILSIDMQRAIKTDQASISSMDSDDDRNIEYVDSVYYVSEDENEEVEINGVQMETEETTFDESK